MSILSSKGRMQDKFSANSKAKQGKLLQQIRLDTSKTQIWEI